MSPGRTRTADPRPSSFWCMSCPARLFFESEEGRRSREECGVEASGECEVESVVVAPLHADGRSLPPHHRRAATRGRAYTGDACGRHPPRSSAPSRTSAGIGKGWWHRVCTLSHTTCSKSRLCRRDNLNPFQNLIDKCVERRGNLPASLWFATAGGLL